MNSLEDQPHKFPYANILKKREMSRTKRVAIEKGKETLTSGLNGLKGIKVFKVIPSVNVHQKHKLIYFALTEEE